MNRREWLGAAWRLVLLAGIGAAVRGARFAGTGGGQAVARCERCGALPGCALPEGASARRFLGKAPAAVAGNPRRLCEQEAG